MRCVTIGRLFVGVVLAAVLCASARAGTTSLPPQIVLVLLLGGAGFAYQRVRGSASIGAAYVAKEVCSCIFVAAAAWSRAGPTCPRAWTG